MFCCMALAASLVARATPARSFRNKRNEFRVVGTPMTWAPLHGDTPPASRPHELEAQGMVFVDGHGEPTAVMF